MQRAVHSKYSVLLRALCDVHPLVIVIALAGHHVLHNLHFIVTTVVLPSMMSLMCYATVMACDDLCHHMSHVTCSDALLRVFAYSGFGLCFACDAFSSILYLFRVVTFLASSDGKHVHLWINHYQKWYFFGFV